MLFIFITVLASCAENEYTAIKQSSESLREVSFAAEIAGEECIQVKSILSAGVETKMSDVTLASYGRPRLKIRATSDPSGMHWEEPVELPLSDTAETDFWKRSCFYTGLLSLSDREALLIHSDFRYPNGDGIGVKSILVRKITVVSE